ncbi:MAG: hypothetical protein ACUVUG_04880 [Candidatus Aminicenantia bacterium]
MNITSKNISGYQSSTFFRDTGCVIHESHTKGNLIEGNMSKKYGGIYTAYWKLDADGHSTVKNIKGCMQDPIPPIKGSEEQPDWRFEGIIDPNIGRLRQLCSSVKKTPELGYCNEIPLGLGFYGQMIRNMPPLPDKYSRGEGNEVYEWYAKKVPCECSAKITDYRGDVKINGMPLSGEGRINLSGTVVETGRRSSVTIKIGESGTLVLHSNSTVDLTKLCEEELEAKRPTVKKFFIKLIHGPAWLLYRIAPKGSPESFKFHGGSASGVRGSLDNIDKVLLASATDSLLALPKLSKSRDEIEIEEIQFDNDTIKKADVILYAEYNPEERYIFIKSIKGKVKLRDSSGYQRFLNEGERLYKKWTSSTPSSEFKEVYAIIGP